MFHPGLRRSDVHNDDIRAIRWNADGVKIQWTFVMVLSVYE